jgi:hypothetical protein
VSATATARPKQRQFQRRGDRVFAGATRIAALTILLALAGVAIF